MDHINKIDIPALIGMAAGGGFPEEPENPGLQGMGGLI
jgi:hypothetical protein